MVEIIAHRRNRLVDLDGLDPAYGAEIDIRSYGNKLVLNHDPFNDGDALERYLEHYARSHAQRLLILNTKEDGHEEPILELMSKFGLKRFFFLDTTVPTMVKLVTRRRERRLAVRVSDYEPAEFAKRFSGLVDWVWLDCFDGKAPALELVNDLKRSFKICLVSPELQDFPVARIDYFLSLKSSLDAVCTKFPEHWR